MKNGLLLIDKPSGMTSHDVVASIRRASSQKQVGHAGTLDPLATGLMVVLMGEATKLSDFVLNGDKAYEVDCLLGVTTDSGDLDGQVTQKKSVDVSLEKIRTAVQSLQGDFVWRVPIFSAAKVDGKKLYESARAGVEVVAPEKKMVFYQTELLEATQDRVRVYLRCSKGSFVRTWVEKLGDLLGTGATVAALRRVSSLPYSIKSAVPLNQYTNESQGSHWIPIEESLPDWPTLRLEGVEEKLVKNGQIPHRVARFLEIEYMAPEIQGVKVMSQRTRQIIALLSRGERQYSLKRVFNIS